MLVHLSLFFLNDLSDGIGSTSWILSFFAVLLYRRHQYHQQRIRLQTGKAKGLLLPGYCEYCF
jgi:hypothetical protein